MKNLSKEIFNWADGKGLVYKEDWVKAFCKRKYRAPYFRNLQFDEQSYTTPRYISDNFIRINNFHKNTIDIWDFAVNIGVNGTWQDQSLPLVAQISISYDGSLNFSYNGDGAPLRKRKLTDKNLKIEIYKLFKNSEIYGKVAKDQLSKLRG